MTVEEVITAHVNTPVTPPNQVVTNISQPTSDALVTAMAKLPAARFQSYDELIMALTAARSQLLVRQFNMNPAADPEQEAKGWWRR